MRPVLLVAVVCDGATTWSSLGAMRWIAPLSAATKKGDPKGGEQREEQLHSLRRNESGKPTARGRTYIQAT